MTQTDPRAWSRQKVPLHEIDHVRAEIAANSGSHDTDRLAQSYRAAGLEVTPDPFGPVLSRQITAALRAKTPYSAIRIGDGEISFLAYGADPATPILDRFALEMSVMKFHDRFWLTEAWADRLKAMMQEAVAAADAVGVLGLWRAQDVDAQTHADLLQEKVGVNIRGTTGYWRGIRRMQVLAASGALDGKLICPAHFYFGLALDIADLIGAAARTLCLTNRSDAVAGLRRRFPDAAIEHLELRSDFLPEEDLPSAPDFLWQVASRLPEDLQGQLVLIGAGAWAEFYCSWVRERGGVAVDIGSAFDLMQGTVTRPIHKNVLEHRNLTVEDFTAPR